MALSGPLATRSQHLPGRAAPSFTAPLRRDGGEGLSPPTQSTSASRRTGGMTQPDAEVCIPGCRTWMPNPSGLHWLRSICRRQNILGTVRVERFQQDRSPERWRARRRTRADRTRSVGCPCGCARRSQPGQCEAEYEATAEGDPSRTEVPHRSTQRVSPSSQHTVAVGTAWQLPPRSSLQAAKNSVSRARVCAGSSSARK